MTPVRCPICSDLLLIGPCPKCSVLPVGVPFPACTGPLIPWLDIYAFLPDGRELRQKNRDRLAELEAQTAERQFRLGVAAEARRAEEER